MEDETPDIFELLENVIRGENPELDFPVGSLWWISEQIWRSSSSIVNRTWQSGSRSHPGTFLATSHPEGSPFLTIHAGRTPKLEHEHRNDIIIELRPRTFPGKFTKFGGNRGFIGQISKGRLLKSRLPNDQQLSACESWLHPNQEVPSLHPPDHHKLLQWQKNIFRYRPNAQ